MQTNLKSISVLVTLLLLSACASIPNGPSVMALPGTGKDFEQFRYDDGYCRQYALQEIGGKTANQAANESLAKSAAVGTAIGAVAGAAVGGGNATGVGAATGLIVGSAIGADEANASSYGAQSQYDNAYIQCMYAKGHRVPVWGRMSPEPEPASSPPPRSAGYPPPPPPPGYKPPDAAK
jgi:hypothetical protein